MIGHSSRGSSVKRTTMRYASIICAALLLLADGAAAQQGDKAIPKTTINLGTATPGGGFPLYGDAFAEIMNAADPTLSIEPRNTKGSNENIPLLEKGELDIALVAGEPSYEAFMGIGRPATRLKILTAMYSSPGMFVVRADSPYKTIRDLVGHPVAFGAKGSGLPWCRTAAPQPCGAPASAGPVLRPWRVAPAARASSPPTRRRSRASAPS